jgi:hypothetical protein
MIVYKEVHLDVHPWLSTICYFISKMLQNNSSCVDHFKKTQLFFSCSFQEDKCLPRFQLIILAFSFTLYTIIIEMSKIVHSWKIQIYNSINLLLQWKSYPSIFGENVISQPSNIIYIYIHSGYILLFCEHEIYLECQLIYFETVFLKYQLYYVINNLM